jgi:two-component system KDP operon response regulator KdpE
VATVHEALEVLGGDGRPDVVLLDLTLSDMHGAALIEAFLAAGPLPPLIVISASTERTLRGAAERLHARGALRKPFGSDALLLAIEEAASRARGARLAAGPAPRP